MVAFIHNQTKIMAKEEAVPTTPHEKLLLKFFNETRDSIFSNMVSFNLHHSMD